jgi:methyl-accepting chemotaxis protein
MNLLGVKPAQPAAPTAVEERISKDLDDQLRDALRRHKEASDRVVTKSLDQVQRSADVTIAVKSIIRRVEETAAADTMEEAYDLIRRGGKKHADP